MRELKFRRFIDGRWWNMDLYKTVEGYGDSPLQQYTGQLDATGKEIYEGDLIRLKPGDQRMLEVRWTPSESSYCLFDRSNQPVMDLCCDWPDKLVVGNISDNKMDGA